MRDTFILLSNQSELKLEQLGEFPINASSTLLVRKFCFKESLKHAGGFGTLETNISPHMDQNMATQALSPRHDQPTSATSMQNNGSEKSVKQKEKWVEQQKNALMVVASLIATIAFQVGLNPPGGVWQDYSTEDPHRKPGESILAYKCPDNFEVFHVFNTTGFIASLSIILLLMSGLPLRRRLFMWILMVITWIAISAIAMAYIASITLLAPYSFGNTVDAEMIKSSIIVWLCLVGLLIIGHTVRLIVKVVPKQRKRRTERGSAVLEVNVAP